MEGLVDPLVREFWSAIGGFDLMTTEFIRVTNHLLPPHVYVRDCPELENGSRTRAGTPVAVQLLGGDPVVLAENAAQAAGLGAHAIDLNFGCPAPTVNRHDGGAVLLQYPERILRIVEAVRKAVPASTPVTAKLRIGFLNTELCLENALAAASGGAARLTIHCRTKADFYRPPAFWEWIPRIRARVNEHGLRPAIFANGEIWTRADFENCRRISAADGYMIGRGAIADPLLALRLRGELVPEGWASIEPWIEKYFEFCVAHASPRYAVTRMKQWLRLMAPRWPEAQVVFEAVKAAHTTAEVARGLRAALGGGTPLSEVAVETPRSVVAAVPPESLGRALGV